METQFLKKKKNLFSFSCFPILSTQNKQFYQLLNFISENNYNYNKSNNNNNKMASKRKSFLAWNSSVERL